MRVRLERRDDDGTIVTLHASVRFDDTPLRLRYRTRTGALLTIDGAIAGAFDGKHETLDLPAQPGPHELELRVEHRALPIAGLPDGDGLRWRTMLARATQTPSTDLGVETRDTVYGATPQATAGEVPLVGHAHLDVAWLWTFAETRRKAQRTFATAIRQVELDDRFVFAQSQPQLYAWLEHDAPDLVTRIRAQLGGGWDASVASMWVEPDLHAPSGESVLRQFLYGVGFMRDRFGVEPDVVWLPDTFGFPSTLPQLAVHAGMRSFVTTKLQWNDTTRWPYPQFRWFGDDGSSLVAAVVASYDGEATPARKAAARERHELLIEGYGDGGGGVTDAMIASEAPSTRPWTTVCAWMLDVDGRLLPEYRGELYLENHRGTYTTHRALKAGNAELERALAEVEELCAWCVAVRTPPSAVKPLADDLRNAWTIVLRHQFHDVMAGTSIGAVYDDVREEQARALRIVERVRASAASILPRVNLVRSDPAAVPAIADASGFTLENEFVRAHVRADGIVDELAAVGGPNVVALANGLRLFTDRPKHWDAWNLDRGYDRRRLRLSPDGAADAGDGVTIRFRAKDAAVTMRLALHAGEPYLRVELAVAWNATHQILRAEHRFAVRTTEVRYGQPHGTLVRTAFQRDDAERARYEVPAQRWVHATDGDRGCAIFARDLYGWNAVALTDGGVRIGTSLLRSPAWPDPAMDRGEHRLAYALVPTAGATIAALENAWELYASDERVRLFTCDDPAVLVVATKPAEDGNGVIVRVRECDGEARRVALRCGGRARTASAVDAVERPIDDAVELIEESLHFTLPPFALRAFRVTL